MKSSFVLTSLLFTLSTGIAPAAMAQAQPAPSASAPYPQAIADGFIQSCIQGTKKQSPKASAETVNSYCRCILSQVQSRVPVGDFVELDVALQSRQPKLSKEQTQTSAAITQSSQYCVNQQRTGTP